MKKIGMLFLFIFFVSACSSDEAVNPEDTLDHYITAWEGQNYDEMFHTLNTSSEEELNGYEWNLSERFEKVHEDLGVNSIEITYESRDFAEEEIDLEETEELDYQVHVGMNTITGDISYTTNVLLTKEIDMIEDEEVEVWSVDWHPSHLFMGLKTNDDQIQVSTEPSNRGEIFDRYGTPLATNGEVYEVGFVPERMEDFDDATNRFADILNIDVETVRDLANRYPDNPDWFAPVQHISLSDERVDDLLNIPGVLLNREEGREYHFGGELAHLIGYVGQITAEELEEREGEGYHMNSIIGKRGLEAALENDLRGEPGVTISVADEEGNTRDVLMKSDPVHGDNITLTIDVSIQEKLVDTFGDDTGAGVVMDPTSGEVLALVSLPSYDSNLRYLQLTDPRAESIDDPNTLITRRFQNVYSPGSAFKPFTAAAGLEEGTLDPDEVFEIEGKQWQPDDGSWGDYRITRVNEQVSDIDLKTGMMYSDNIYFAMQALALGEEKMESWAETFGFGEPFPFGFPMNASSISNDGLSSEPLLADTGYGQGQVLMNPLHLASLYTMFIHDGSVIQPQLFEGSEPEMWKEDTISPETANIVLDSLIAVVEDSNGTASRENPGHNRALAGKTGTAELKDSLEDESGEELGWYVAFDYEEKDLLIAVMIEDSQEHGGSGYAVDLVNEFVGKVE
ncbi:penicillin-binding transpeptidase domain-containing protein [Evansella halocellulosilytica]|uniref:penicillin-binding transpeptidase domain-containing protein n=1 Tax=Evansella halocellulosilytica TaxID=2011013 RepID=UPI000BB7C6DA|nr:penicillin-binding transpeptidase domain-containing protein [Evansella halocellulosilytica]